MPNYPHRVAILTPSWGQYACRKWDSRQVPIPGEISRQSDVRRLPDDVNLADTDPILDRGILPSNAHICMISASVVTPVKKGNSHARAFLLHDHTNPFPGSPRRLRGVRSAFNEESKVAAREGSSPAFPLTSPLPLSSNTGISMASLPSRKERGGKA